MGGPIYRAATVLAGGSAVAQALGAINVIVLARFLAPDDYGQFAAVYATVGLSAFLFTWGLDTWLLRQAATTEDHSGLAGQVVTIKGALALPWAALILVALPLLHPGLYPRELVFIAAVDVAADAILATTNASLNARQRSGAVSSMLTLSRGGRLLSTLVLALAGVHSTVPFAAGRLAATLISVAAGFLAVRPAVGLRHRSAAVTTLRASAPFAASDVLAAIYLQADVTLVALMMNSPAQVAWYASATSLISAAFVVPNAGYVTAIPALMKARSRAPGGMAPRVSAVLRLAAFAGIGLALAVALAGGWLATALLGPAYAATGMAVTLLSPLLFFKCLSYGSAAILVAAGWQRRRVMVQTVSAAFNVGANVVAIPLAGIYGAAAVYVASEAVLAAGYLLLVRRWRTSEAGANMVTGT